MALSTNESAPELGNLLKALKDLPLLGAAPLGSLSVRAPFANPSKARRIARRISASHRYLPKRVDLVQHATNAARTHSGGLEITASVYQLFQRDEPGFE